MPTDRHNLSAVDQAILRIMQQNSSTRLEDIAHEAGASVATIQRRLRVLRRNGVIEGASGAELSQPKHRPRARYPPGECWSSAA